MFTQIDDSNRALSNFSSCFREHSWEIRGDSLRYCPYCWQYSSILLVLLAVQQYTARTAGSTAVYCSYCWQYSSILPVLLLLLLTSCRSDTKLFILVGLGRSFFVCCLAHRGSTVGFLLLQCSTPQGSPGVGRNTFLSSPYLCFIIVFICDLFVSLDDPLMS